jgi:hypothetical protein
MIEFGLHAEKCALSVVLGMGTDRWGDWGAWGS